MRKRGVFCDLLRESVITGTPSQPGASQSLIARIAANDQNAWEKLVRLYGPLVLTWGRRAGLQSADVADLTQEVFGVVSQRIDRFDPTRHGVGGFRLWIWGITRVCLMKLQELTLSGSLKVHGAGIDALNQCTDLKVLNLSGTHIGDEDIPAILALENFKVSGSCRHFDF